MVVTVTCEEERGSQRWSPSPGRVSVLLTPCTRDLLPCQQKPGGEPALSGCVARGAAPEPGGTGFPNQRELGADGGQGPPEDMRGLRGPVPSRPATQATDVAVLRPPGGRKLPPGPVLDREPGRG